MQIKDFNQDQYTVVILPTFIIPTGNLYVFVERQNNTDYFLSTIVEKSQFDEWNLKQSKSADLTKVNNLLPHHFLNTVFDKTIHDDQKISEIPGSYAVVYKNEKERLCAIMLLYQKVRTPFVIKQHGQVYIGCSIDNINVIDESVDFFKVAKQQDIKHKKTEEFFYALVFEEDTQTKKNSSLYEELSLKKKYFLHISNTYVFTFPLIHQYAETFKDDIKKYWTGFFCSSQKNNMYWSKNQECVLLNVDTAKISHIKTYSSFHNQTEYKSFLNTVFPFGNDQEKAVPTSEIKALNVEVPRRFFKKIVESYRFFNSDFFTPLIIYTREVVNRYIAKQKQLEELAKIKELERRKELEKIKRESDINGFSLDIEKQVGRRSLEDFPDVNLEDNLFLWTDKNKQADRKNKLKGFEETARNSDENNEPGSLSEPNESDGETIPELTDQELGLDVKESSNNSMNVEQQKNENNGEKPSIFSMSGDRQAETRYNVQTWIEPFRKNKILALDKGTNLNETAEQNEPTKMKNQAVPAIKELRPDRFVGRSKVSELEKYVKLLFEYEKTAPAKLRSLLFKKNTHFEYNINAITGLDKVKDKTVALTNQAFKREQAIAEKKDEVLLVVPAVALLPVMQKIQPNFAFHPNEIVKIDKPATSVPITLQLLPGNQEVVLLSAPQAPISPFFQPEHRPDRFFTRIPTLKEKITMHGRLFCIISFANQYSELEKASYVQDRATHLMYISKTLRDAILKTLFSAPEGATKADQPVKLITDKSEYLSGQLVEEPANGNQLNNVLESAVEPLKKFDENNNESVKNPEEVVSEPVDGLKKQETEPVSRPEQKQEILNDTVDPRGFQEGADQVTPKIESAAGESTSEQDLEIELEKQFNELTLADNPTFNQEGTLAKRNDKVLLVFPTAAVLPFLQKLQPGFAFQLNDKIDIDQPAVAFPVVLQLLPGNQEVVLLSVPRVFLISFFKSKQQQNSFFSKLPTFKEKSTLQATLFCIVSFAKKYSELEAVNYMHNLDTGIMYVSIRMRDAILKNLFSVPEGTKKVDQPVNLLTNTPEPLLEQVVEQLGEVDQPVEQATPSVVAVNQAHGNNTEPVPQVYEGNSTTNNPENPQNKTPEPNSQNSKETSSKENEKKDEDLPWWLRWLPDLVQNWLKDFLKKKE